MSHFHVQTKMSKLHTTADTFLTLLSQQMILCMLTLCKLHLGEGNSISS